NHVPLNPRVIGAVTFTVKWLYQRGDCVATEDHCRPWTGAHRMAWGVDDRIAGRDRSGVPDRGQPGRGRHGGVPRGRPGGRVREPPRWRARSPDPPAARGCRILGRGAGGGRTPGIGRRHRRRGELRASRLPMAATFPYTLRRLDYDALAANIARARPDVLMVAAYLEDGVALRRSLVRARVPLVASIGTSSSYCMPAFGQMLGRQA